MQWIEIDGAAGEGGGQVLRSSLALAALTGKAFRLVNIRAGRAKPGLAAQHLMCVKAASAVCRGRYKGGAIGSMQLSFEPGEVKAGAYDFAIGTAGATALVLQTIALPLALRGQGPSEVTVSGGTHAAHAPTYDYLATTWAGYLRLMGLDLTLSLHAAGFYPRGGGKLHALIPNVARLEPLTLLTRPDLTEAGGAGAVAGLPASVAERIAARLSAGLTAAGVGCDIPTEEWPGGPGAVANVVFRQAPVPTLISALGERGKPAETVADEAVAEALAYRASGAPVDPHAADQIALPLAFAAGVSTYKTSDVTRHLATNLDVIKQFLDQELSWDLDEDATGVVRVAGPAV